MAPFDIKTIEVSSAHDQWGETVLILPNLEEGTVLVIEGDDGRCTLPVSRASGFLGNEMQKSFSLELDFTFLRQVFQERTNIRYLKTTSDVRRCVWIAELQGSRRTVPAPYKWVPLETVTVTHPKKDVFDAIRQELLHIAEGFDLPRHVPWGPPGWYVETALGHVKHGEKSVMKCKVCCPRCASETRLLS